MQDNFITLRLRLNCMIYCKRFSTYIIRLRQQQQITYTRNIDDHVFMPVLHAIMTIIFSYDTTNVFQEMCMRSHDHYNVFEYSLLFLI